MSKPFKGTINIDIKDSTPDWAPSVLYIVLDDVGFSALESYGGMIETPNIKRIADRGLMYTYFYTTALCSPTRSGSRTTSFPGPAACSGVPDRRLVAEVRLGVVAHPRPDRGHQRGRAADS